MTSSYRYPVSRAPRKRFESREAYLGHRINAPNAQLCQVMQKAADEQWLVAGRRPGDRSGWQGFPWLTLVFGSGSLELHDGSGVAARSLASQVQEIIREHQLPWVEGADGDSPQTRAYNFTLSLAQDRMGNAPERADEQMLADSGHSVEVVGAKLVYAACLLTQFFHSVRSAVNAPLSRWEDVATLTADQGEEAADADALVSQARRLMFDIRATLKGQGDTQARPSIRRSVDALLGEIIKGLAPSDEDDRRELRSDHLRLITEVAWYFLTLGTPIYPGWTDLLLALMLEEGPRPDRDFRGARPRYPDLRSLPRLVADIYEKSTQASWETSVTRLLAGDTSETADARRSEVIHQDKLTDRDHLYWAAAEILWAQAEAHNPGSEADEGERGQRGYSSPGRADTRNMGDARLLPPAGAFVTSFDLELDMALLATARGRLFRVAIPVHKIDQSGIHAELCWFVADVVPQADLPVADQLDSLRKPVNWRLLTSEFDPVELRSAPIVIHLSGCPLFTLPKPGNDDDKVVSERILADLADGRDPVKRQDVDFDHAVMVDEYLALRQSEAELIWSSRDTVSSSMRRNRALHEDLMINNLLNPRFWMSMGVPVGDAAVRHRLVSQLTRQRMNALSRPDRGPAPPSALLGNDAPLGDEMTLESAEGAADAPPVDPAADDAGAVGVAINTRIGDDETSLLYWVGFDVVQANCNDFVWDLRHYARHVKRSGRYKQPPTTQTCPLLEGEI